MDEEGGYGPGEGGRCGQGSGDGEEFVGLEGEAPAGIGEAVGDGGGGDGGVACGVAGVAWLQGVVCGGHGEVL